MSAYHSTRYSLTDGFREVNRLLDREWDRLSAAHPKRIPDVQGPHLMAGPVFRATIHIDDTWSVITVDVARQRVQPMRRVA